MAERKSLDRATLRKSFLCWLFFLQVNYNFERLQSLGFCHAMIPVLAKLYQKKEDLVAALKRHLAFFNTEPTWGSMIPGLCAALEEEKANDQPISDEMINALKTSLMGPLAGIGDTITQGLMKTIFLAIGIDLAVKGNSMGPVIFFLLMSGYAIGVSWFMYYTGYRLGRNAIQQMLQSNILDQVTSALSIVGLMVTGALAAGRVNPQTLVKFTIGKTTVAMQPILNQIMPGLLGLSFLLLVWQWLRKGTSPVRVIGYIFAIGFACSLLKILG